MLKFLALKNGQLQIVNNLKQTNRYLALASSIHEVKRKLNSRPGFIWNRLNNQINKKGLSDYKPIQNLKENITKFKKSKDFHKLSDLHADLMKDLFKVCFDVYKDEDSVTKTKSKALISKYLDPITSLNSMQVLFSFMDIVIRQTPQSQREEFNQIIDEFNPNNFTKRLFDDDIDVNSNHGFNLLSNPPKRALINLKEPNELSNYVELNSKLYETLNDPNLELKEANIKKHKNLFEHSNIDDLDFAIYNTFINKAPKALLRQAFNDGLVEKYFQGNPESTKQIKDLINIIDFLNYGSKEIEVKENLNESFKHLLSEIDREISHNTKLRKLKSKINNLAEIYDSKTINNAEAMLDFYQKYFITNKSYKFDGSFINFEKKVKLISAKNLESKKL